RWHRYQHHDGCSQGGLECGRAPEKQHAVSPDQGTPRFFRQREMRRSNEACRKNTVHLAAFISCKKLHAFAPYALPNFYLPGYTVFLYSVLRCHVLSLPPCLSP